MDCLFCNIIAGKIPCNQVYEDEHIIAFDDIAPRAPHHKLIIPRRHISTLNDLTDADSSLIGDLVKTASLLAKQLGVAEAGYRVVMNCNAGAGQTVFHVHLHLLAGRPLSWPPG